MMSVARPLLVHNAHAFPLADCPVLAMEPFRRVVIDQIAGGGRLVALFGHSPEPAATRLMAVLAQAEPSNLAVVACDVDREYPAITPECPEAHLFEREIFEQWNVRPVGHPWLKPVRYHDQEEFPCLFCEYPHVGFRHSWLHTFFVRPHPIRL